MELLALHVCPLDDDSEADQVVQLLTKDGIPDTWRVERPTEATNGLFVPVELDLLPKEDWQIRQQKLAKSRKLLDKLKVETVRAIRAMGLGIAMRIHTQEFYLPLPWEFVSACGRLELEICIFNDSDFDDDES